MGNSTTHCIYHLGQADTVKAHPPETNLSCAVRCCSAPPTTPDLALPALVGVAFHGTWTALIAAEVAIIGLPDDCAGRHLASSTVVWLLVSFALTTLLQCVVAFISMRGAWVYGCGGELRPWESKWQSRGSMCSRQGFTAHNHSWCNESCLPLCWWVCVCLCDNLDHQVPCWRSTSALPCRPRCTACCVRTAWRLLRWCTQPPSTLVCWAHPSPHATQLRSWHGELALAWLAWV